MGLFTRKPKVKLSEFCKDFYERITFSDQVSVAFSEVAFRSVADADQRFGNTDKDKFGHEIRLVHLEIFGLAFLHSGRSAGFAVAQAIFTRQFLEKTNKLSLWDEAESYNSAIAESCTHGYDGHTPAGRARFTFVRQIRMDTFDEWAEKERVDTLSGDAQEAALQCIGRACNRLGTPPEWDGPALPGSLICTLLKRLGIEDLSQEALFRLTGIMLGMYNGAREAINAVSIVE